MRILRLSARIWTTILTVSLALVLGGLAIRLLLPLLSWATPPRVVSVLPSNGARDVSPRSTIALRFGEPVNRRSVEQALRMEPAATGSVSWRDDGRTLIFTPAQPLSANVTYTLSLGTDARGRFFQPLAAPVQSTFHTAPAPIVVAAFPNGADVTPDTPIALVFSRPMVAPEALRQPVDLPQLHFDPPLTGSVSWLDQSTLLFRPATPLPPATSFSANLAGALTDLSGSPLGANYTWRFNTRPPTVVRQIPPPDAEQVALTQPLVIELSQPLPVDTIASSITVTPTVAGRTTGVISGTRQIITFTPEQGWSPATSYEVGLRSILPAVGNLALPTARWSFRTAPRPTLVGRFPGQGQLLPRGQAIRLIFSSPVNTATLESGLALSPPVGALHPSVSGAEVRLNPELRTGTTYTLTLRQSITDQGDVPLDQSYQLTFITAPAPPELVLPDLAGHFVSLPANQPPTLTVQRTNLTALTLDLYGLDEATLLRTFDFDNNAWRDFSPERYNQSLLRSWRVPLDGDPPGQSITSTLPLSAQADGADAPFTPGAYYLRLRSPEGQGADLVLLVSQASLTLKGNDRQVVVWATDRLNGTPLGDVPLTLYEGSNVVAQGRTDANGLWLVSHIRQPAAGVYLVLADTFGSPTAAGAGAVVSSAWMLGDMRSNASPSTYQMALFTDQTAYLPGDTMRIGGFVRVATDNQIDLPLPGTPLELSLRQTDSTNVITSSTVRLDRSGVVSTTLVLGKASPGTYVLRAAIGNTVRALPIRLLAKTPPPFDIAFTPDTNGALRLHVTTRQGQPINGATVSWSITGEASGTTDDQRCVPTSLTPCDMSLASGYIFGDDEQPLAPPLSLHGTGTTDTDGMFPIPLPSGATITQTTRLAVSATVEEVSSLSSEATTTLTVPAGDLQLGLHVPRVVAAGERPRLELLTLDRNSAPVPNTTVIIEVLRRTWEPDTGADGSLTQREAQVQSRQVTTDANGRATLELDLRRGGAYRMVATARDAAGTPVRSATSFWLAPSTGFETGWIDRDNQTLLVADQPAYRPGDIAQLLLGLPQAETTALVTLERAGEITATVRTLRASELLSVTIPPDTGGTAQAGHAAPLDVSVLVPRSGGTMLIGSAHLPVVATTPALSVTIQSALNSGSSVEAPPDATLVVTVRDDQGQPVSADLLLGLLDGEQPAGNTLGSTDLGGIFHPTATPPGSIAQTQAILPEQNRTAGGSQVPGRATQTPKADAQNISPTESKPPAFWRSGLRTGSDGTLTLHVPVPNGPSTWRVSVLAGTRTLLGQASTVISSTRVQLEPQLPRALTVGDVGLVSLTLRNPLTQPISVSISLEASELALTAPQSAIQQITLAPRGRQRLDWPVIAGIGTTAQVSFTLQVENSLTRVTRLTLPILPGGSPQVESGTLSGTVRFTSTITPATTTRWGKLELTVARSLTEAVDRSRTFIGEQPPDGLEHTASLLLLDGLLLKQEQARAKDTPTTRVLQEQAAQTLEQLLAQQHDAGSWSWWPDSQSDPVATGYALEALAQIHDAGVNVSSQVQESALSYLIQQLQTRATTEPDVRAYLLYVLALHDRGQPDAARDLLRASTGDRPAQPLRADGLAYLTLALPPDEALAASERLADLGQLAQDTQSGNQTAIWSVEEPSALPRSPVSITALVARALQRTQPSSPLIAPALRIVAYAWGVDGWSTPYDSARAASALLSGVQSEEMTSQQTPTYTITLNNAALQLPEATGSPTTALKLTVPISSASGQLSITGGSDGTGLTPLLAYRLTRDIPLASDKSNTSGMVLARDFLDPVTAQQLDPSQMQLGQLVRVRLTLVAVERHSFVSLREPLSAAFDLIQAMPQAPFEHVTTTQAELIFNAQSLEPGVYVQTYLARAATPGNYSAPPPSIAQTHQPDVAAEGSEARVVVR